MEPAGHKSYGAENQAGSYKDLYVTLISYLDEPTNPWYGYYMNG